MFDTIFRWKFPIGRVFGISINVHLLFLIVVIPLTLSQCVGENVAPGTWIDAFTLAFIVTFAILLHEMGHCFGARAVDGEADEVMLWPLGGVAECSYLPNTPWANFVFSFGGPAVNLVLALLFGLILSFGGESIRPPFNFFTWYPFRDLNGVYHLTHWDGSALETGSFGVMLLVWGFYVNFFLTVFNLALVGWPWDSGAILRSILWPYVGFHRATTYVIFSGFCMACVLFGAAFFFHRNPMLIPLALYTFVMCYREWIVLENRNDESLFGYDFSAGYTSLEKDAPSQSPPRKKQNFIQRWLQKRNARKIQREAERQEAEERRMDELLEKIQQHGKGSLSDEETRFLKRVSDRYRNRH